MFNNSCCKIKPKILSLFLDIFTIIGLKSFLNRKEQEYKYKKTVTKMNMHAQIQIQKGKNWVVASYPSLFPFLMSFPFHNCILQATFAGEAKMATSGGLYPR